MLLTVVLIFAISLVFWSQQNIKNNNKQADQETARTVVENFGHKLKNVSLLSSTAAQDIETNYKDFIAPELLVKWKADPTKALGKLTSNPWPDSIEVESIKQFGSGAYDVNGEIVNKTSAGVVGSTPVEIGVAKFGNSWLITGISIPSNQENKLWKEYKNSEGVSFQYPEKFLTQYVFTQEWPPIVDVKSDAYSCKETPQEISSATEITSQRFVENRTYCVKVKNEGAAGSVYSSYTYTISKNGKLVKVSFVLRYPSCGIYDKEQNRACVAEREAFDLDGIVDRIVQTIK